MPSDDLYDLGPSDVERAALVLADAFRQDPVWNKTFEGDPDAQRRRRALFEIPVRLCARYGRAVAPSSALEGVAGWVPGTSADVTIWRLLGSGAVGSAKGIGLSAARKMGRAFARIARDRRSLMRGRPYLYLEVVGVASHLRGRGYGGKLIRAVIEDSERVGVPIYLETETEENCRMYMHFGFDLADIVTLPLLDLPMWEMIRTPKG